MINKQSNGRPSLPLSAVATLQSVNSSGKAHNKSTMNVRARDSPMLKPATSGLGNGLVKDKDPSDVTRTQSH